MAKSSGGIFTTIDMTDREQLLWGSKDFADVSANNATNAPRNALHRLPLHPLRPAQGRGPQTGAGRDATHMHSASQSAFLNT